ncbi:hypothetical protein [Cellulomonas sp. HZM]|uniref:hypothetical protein n=1 Tax=Cellulomonas sp. HZM TaxID=1454010 RepID=UPI0004934B67|nr:hypothetical protein [Cellulomonas sp. HZM]
MRRLLVIITTVLASVALVAGVAVAGLVGPDDWASVPGITTTADGPVSTTPTVLALRDARLRITVDGPGEVFVGTANPVDVESYLAGVRRLSVDELKPSGATHAVIVPGDARAPQVSPPDATFWLSRAHGSGSTSIDLQLDGVAPLSLVAMPVTGDGPLTMSVALRVPHAFAVAAGTAGAALVVLVLVALARRRARRDPSASSGAASSATVGDDVRRAGVPSALRAASIPVVVTAALTGCAAVPSRVPTADPQRVSITQRELGAAVSSYNDRNNKAIARAAAGDATLWAGVDLGAVLREDEYDTAYARAARSHKKAQKTTVRVDRAFAPSFSSYPMWFVASGTMSSGTTSDDHVWVFERASAVAPWRMSASADVRAGDVPTPVPTDRPSGARPSTATDAEVAAAKDASDVVRDFVRTGVSSKLVAGTDVADFRATLEKPAKATDSYLAPVQLDPLASDGTQDAATATRVVPTADGALAVTTYSYVAMIDADYGRVLSLGDPVVAKLTHQTGDLDAVVIHGVLTVVTRLPHEGSAKILGASWSTTLG